MNKSCLIFLSSGVNEIPLLNFRKSFHNSCNGYICYGGSTANYKQNTKSWKCTCKNFAAGMEKIFHFIPEDKAVTILSQPYF